VKINYKNVLVTGGAGFIGSNLAISFKQKCPQLEIVVLDNLIRSGSELNLPRLEKFGVEFIKGDIRNPEDLELGRKIDLLIECSAEPSVLAGYGEDPKYIIDTNLIGTVNCLEVVRKNKSDLVFLSTSRVYPYKKLNNIKRKEQESRFEWEKQSDSGLAGFSEKGIGVDFPLEGVRSMYGATKLASEIIIQEYLDMYGLRGVINRCGVVSGAWQFGKVDQGIFALWMLAHYFKKPLKYIGFGGRGKQVRDLLSVDNLFDLIELQLDNLDKVNGQVYNVGGGLDISLSLLEATKLCEEITGNKIDISSDEATRPADVAIYITDNTKVYNDLGWKPKKDALSILKDVYSWIKNNEKDLKNLI